MIIISQDKDGIINFDNINEIRTTKTGKILLFDNTYRSQDDCSDFLGKYKTEKRAKEILRKIVDLYINCSYGARSNGIPIPVFQMPKE